MFKIYPVLTKAALCAVFLAFAAMSAFAQGGSSASVPSAKKPASPKVTRIDFEGLKKVLKPNGKPLLVNFWATWCDPCREEFPDLVKLDKAYKGRVDFITVSLDDLDDIDTIVPKFLNEVKSEMPAYLLNTPDESAAIMYVSKDWSGSLPLTAIYNAEGAVAYTRPGKIRYETVVTEIDKLLPPDKQGASLHTIVDFVKIKNGKRDEALYFYENNWKVYRDEALRRGLIASYELIEARSENNSLFDLMLITRYKNQEQYKNSEKNFEPILKELRPAGPMLKNALRPDDFRHNVFLYVGPTAFSSFDQ